MDDHGVTETAPAGLRTDQELAARWRTTTRHIRRLRVEAGLPYIKIGRRVRFDPDDIATWLANHRQSSVAS